MKNLELLWVENYNQELSIKQWKLFKIFFDRVLSIFISSIKGQVEMLKKTQYLDAIKRMLCCLSGDVQCFHQLHNSFNIDGLDLDVAHSTILAPATVGKQSKPPTLHHQEVLPLQRLFPSSFYLKSKQS